MTDTQTNLRVLKPSRKVPRAGDVFTMQLPDGRYLYGRVIDADITEPTRAPMPGSNLIYVYRYRSTDKEPDLSQLTPDQLLIPPVFINKMPWTKGYFETVAHEDITNSDRLRQHCFWDALRQGFIDENRRPLPREVPPCGEWGLASYRLLDDLVSDALGIPRVPE